MKKQFLIISIFCAALITDFLQGVPDSSIPTVSRVYGDQFTPQVADTQSAAQIGTLDDLFGTNGSLNIDGVLSGSKAVGIETLSNGNFLVVLGHDAATTDAKVAMYNAEGILQASYGTAGVVDLGAVKSPRATMLDAQGRLLVAGGDTTGTAGWIKRIAADGSSVTTFTVSGAWQFVGGLAQQTTGQIIAVGFNGTYAQIARYNLNGTLDTTFGTAGYVILNGAGGLPTSPHGLYGVIVDASDNMYMLMLDSAGSGSAYLYKLNSAGVNQGTQGLEITLLSGATAPYKLAFNQDGNIILAAAVSNVIKVTARTTSGGAVGTFTNFASTTINANNYLLNDIEISSGSDSYGYIYLVGSNTSNKEMAVIRLGAHSGALDTAFNDTGYNFFAISGSLDSSVVTSVGLALDGQLYVPGYEAVEGSTTPYVSRLNNTQYVYEIAQFPAAQEQGILDLSFGNDATQTYTGVTSPYNGSYGSSLMQRAQQAVEITTQEASPSGSSASIGDILIGMNGKTNSSASSNMMLSWLTATGDVDDAVGGSGFLTLANSSASYEYLTQILQGPSGVVFVSGYASDTDGGASTQAFVRTYTPAGTTTWSVGTATWNNTQATANWKGVGVGYQSSATRTLLFVDESDGPGHITAYNGTLDTSWGDAGSGTISSTSYGLNMGPVYNGGLIDAGDNLIVAYVDADDGFVKVAAFIPDGSDLLTTFGQGTPAGVSVNLFDGATDILATNVRCCFNSDGDILVAAINDAGTSLLFTLLSGDTGDVDTNFGTAGVLTVAVSGSSSLALKDVIGVSDGTAVATFYNDASDDMMYLARIVTISGEETSAGYLDTSFNSQGLQPGVFSFQIGDRVTNYNARAVTCSLIQSTEGANQGNIVASVYESVTSNDAAPMIVRSYGDPGTTQVMSYPIEDTGVPGTFDVAYDLVTDLGNAAAKVIYTYLSGSVHEGYSLIGYDNGTTSLIARYDITTNNLDATFGGGSGIFTIPGSLSGISTINIDAQNRIVVGGTDSGTAWAMQVSENGTSAVAFGSFPAGMNSVNQILQQTSGRYIVAGSTTTPAGIVAAFQDELVSPATTLALDPTFNPLAGSSPAGGNTPASYIITGNAGIYSIAINSDDTILAVYKVTGSGFLTIAEITADGSGLVSGFNSGAVVTTAITPDSSAVCRVAINNDGYVVVAASTGSGANVKLQRFTSAGGTDASWNETGAIVTVSNLGSAGITLSDVMVTTANQTVFLGYNSAGGNGPLFAARIDAAGELDSTWNPDPTAPDTAGVLTFATNSVVQMNGSSICIDGKIVAVGQQVGGTEGDPIVMYVYGDNYVIQIAQAPLEVAAGQLDYTIPGGSTGAWALSDTITGVPQKIAIYNNSSNGAVMLASSNGVNSYVTMLNADLSVANSAAYGTNGVATLVGQTSVNDMYLVGDVNSDTLAPIYVTGRTAGAMWGANISANGDTITYLDDAGGLTFGNVIRQTNNGRILVAGFNGSFGSIAAFGSVTSDGVYPLDTSFGNNADTAPYYGGGVYATGVATQIYDMAVDSLDRIYIAYFFAGHISVIRLLANGTAVDTDFNATFTTAVNSYSESQIRLALDEENEQLVVAAQDGTGTSNIIQVCRFSTVDGSDAGLTSAVTIASKVLNLSDLFIDAEQNIYVVGYNSTDSYAVVARIASTSSTTIALDTTGYAVDGGTPGIANLDSGSMTVVTAGAYDPDRRTYLVGSNGGSNGYMARVYGDIYTSQVSEAIATAEVGAIDTSLQPNNTGEIDLSGQIHWSGLAGYKAYAIIENFNNDGTSFIAFGNGVDVIVGKVDADMNPIAEFGDSGTSDGLTGGLTMPTINSITLDSDGNILVAGSNGGLQKVLSWTADGDRNATFATTVASTNGSVVVQQKSGRYIVGGYDGSANGLIIAYKNESAIDGGILPVDETFGPAGSNGFYATGVNARIDDICIDDNDNIYFTYVNPSNVVCLGKLTANGSGLVDDQNSPEGAFNGGSIVSTGIIGVTGGHPSRIAINDEGNILVGNTRVTGVGTPRVQTELYNGITGLIIGTNQTIITTNVPVLTKLVGAGSEFYGSVYNTAPVVGVFAINSSGVLDTNFGTAGITTVGGATYEYVKAMYGLSIQADGKLAVVGYNNPSNDESSFNPSFMRFFGYEYVPQFEQAPNRVDAGQLDTTIWPLSGAFPLNNTTNDTFNDLLVGYSVSRVYEYGNGIMTFIADKNSVNSTVIFQLNKDLTLNSSFGLSGWRQFTGIHGGTTGMYVDSLGNIYACGIYDGGYGPTTSWVVGMDSTGTSLVPSLDFTISSFTSYAISQQGMNRVILAGLGETNGTLLGYNNEGDLDITFATTGILDVGSALPITDIAIDEWDRIITVQNNDGTVVLKRATASGLPTSGVSAVTTLTGGTAISTANSGSNIKVVLDNGGRIVVAAATSTGYMLRSYNNNDATGTNNAGPVSIAPTGGSGTFILSNIYVTNDDKITLVGYRDGSGTICVARFSSTDGSLTLDTASFDAAGSQPGILYTTIGSLNQANDAIIHADNRVMIVGSNSTSANPYMGRAFGYPYADYVTQGPIEGVPGTINPAFGDTVPTTGTFDLSTLNGVLSGGQGKAILPLSDGGYYLALDKANSASNSVLIKTIASGNLDATYNAAGDIPGIAGSAPEPDYAPTGVISILEDGSHNVVLVGTNNGGYGPDYGWIQRYTSDGALDTSFNGTGIINLDAGTQAAVAIEQTLARLVVAGADADGKGVLYAFESLAPDGIPGTVDVTFNNTVTPGSFVTTISNIIPCVIADDYDRLIFGIVNGGPIVDLYRLTPTGELDITFGVNGVVQALIYADAVIAPASVRVALDQAGNIIVAASDTVFDNIYVRAFDNGTSTATGANGNAVYGQLNINALSDTPIVTNLVTSDDGYALILGVQSSANPAWIARITSDGNLDSSEFNPDAIGGVAGIFQYSGSGATSHTYLGLAVNADGTLGMFGYENDDSAFTPTLVSVYDNPYVSQESQSPDSKVVGTNDVTLGVSPTSTADLGITFFAASGDDVSGQKGRAIGLYDDNNNVVAIDGNSTAGSGSSEIMINMFDNDGIANPNFGDAGSQVALDYYENQYVRSMVTFTTVEGVTKAILAGYTFNSNLNKYDSLLLQYVLTPGESGLDSSFGGYDSNPLGIAFGDGQSLYSVARQSNGRIIAAGLSQNNVGLFLGYGSNGKMDNSFANNGYQSVNTGSTGIYTHAIDTSDRIVFAYNNGSNEVAVARYLADGSALDSSFNPTVFISDISGNTNMKICVDSSNQVYVISVVNSGNTFAINQYAVNGTLGNNVEINYSSLGGSSSSDYVLARLIVDTAGNTIIVAYDNDASRIVIIRLDSAFALDTTFNPNGTPGYITYTVTDGDNQMITDAMIHPDGRILVVGSDSEPI